jgi:hypothetical protein
LGTTKAILAKIGPLEDLLRATGDQLRSWSIIYAGILVRLECDMYFIDIFIHHSSKSGLFRYNLGPLMAKVYELLTNRQYSYIWESDYTIFSDYRTFRHTAIAHTMAKRANKCNIAIYLKEINTLFSVYTFEYCTSVHTAAYIYLSFLIAANMNINRPAINRLIATWGPLIHIGTYVKYRRFNVTILALIWNNIEPESELQCFVDQWINDWP